MSTKKNDIGMYIVDKNYRIIYKNQATVNMHPDVSVGEFCYKAYGKLDEPCPQCPILKQNSLMYNPHRKEWIAAQAAEIVLPEHGQCYVVQFQIKHRLSAVREMLRDAADLEEHIAEISSLNGNEYLIGCYCEEGFPLYYVNDNMIALLGYENREEFIEGIEGKVINIIHPQEHEQVQTELSNNLYPGMIYEMLYRVVKKDGTSFWVINKGKVIEIENGRLAIISACSDVTGFVKRQENLLLQNEELLKRYRLSTTMMNNMPSGYHRCDAKEGCPFLYIGNYFENIVGWTKEEIETEFDNLYQNLVWPEDIGTMRTYSDMLKLKGKGNSYSTDIYRLKRKGGGYRWVLDSTMFVDQGEDSFFQATVADISDFIEKQNEQTRKLEEAMRRVEEANNAKTQFLSAMSHDIRTPMNAIIGMTTLASKHLNDAEYMKKCLSKMSLASRHLLTLVNDVLDISKVESGKMALNPIVFSLAETVTNLINIVRQQISGKGQKFDVRVHNIQQEYLFADELRLNQIFINILTNAVKYTPDGGMISIDLKEELIDNSDRARIVYIVQDNGVGMSEEFQESMYESFARADDMKFGSVQGSGLGLAITKRMIELMDGTIECESAPGIGTKFTVTLELPVAEKIMDDYMLPSMDVLLVDDDEIFLESAADTLKNMGMTPECVTSGKQAIEMTVKRHNQGRDYSVIIVDWQMPEMNGIETIREIRTKVGEEVSIIVVSAYEWSDIEELAKSAGANGFISKPFFPSSVYENMIEVLGLNVGKQEEETYSMENIAGMKILVAEDNDLNWEIAREILDMYDVETFRAINGQECVTMLNESEDGAYDMVLMDIRMPVLNGYEAAQLIREAKREYVKNIPIVAMTADAFSDDIQKCMDVGMNAHIAKPINISNLLAVLGKEGETKRSF